MTNFPEPPQTNILSIESSPHKREIYGQLQSGWSPTRVAMFLRRKYAEVVDPRDILAFLGQIVPGEMLTPGILRERFKNVDVDVDALLEMHLLLRLQKENLDAALQHRTIAEDGGLKTDVIDNAIDKITQRYWKMLIQFQDLMHETGELPPPDADVVRPKSGRMTIKEVMRQTTIEEPSQPASIAAPSTKFIDAPSVKVISDGSHNSTD